MRIFAVLLLLSFSASAQFSMPPNWQTTFTTPNLSEGSIGQCPATPIDTLDIPLNMTNNNVVLSSCTGTVLSASLSGAPICTCDYISCKVKGLLFTPAFLTSMTVGMSGTINNALGYTVTGGPGTVTGTLNIVAKTGTWTPSCLAGSLAIWFDPDDNTTVFADTGTTVQATNGSLVNVWLDKSGNGRHLFGTPAKQPVFATAGINGRDIISLAAGKQIIGASTQNYGITGDRSMFAIVRPDAFSNGLSSDGSGSYYFDRYAGTAPADNPLFSLKSSAGYFMLQRRDDAGSQLGGSTFGVSVNNGTSYLYTGMKQTGTVSTWINATGLQKQVMTTAVMTQKPISLGHATSFMVGSASYGEFLMTTNALGTAQISRVEGYLANRWGINGSLPGTHIYKTTPP